MSPHSTNAVDNARNTLGIDLGVNHIAPPSPILGSMRAIALRARPLRPEPTTLQTAAAPLRTSPGQRHGKRTS